MVFLLAANQPPTQFYCLFTVYSLFATHLFIFHYTMSTAGYMYKQKLIQERGDTILL